MLVTPNLRSAIAAGTLVLGAAPWALAVPADHQVVVELFTAQGCSTCPPADRLLTRLGEEAGVVPLAFHVDFWNHIGWTDPFSSNEWTRRQAAYVRELAAAGAYTPQAVVDGGAELVGSDEPALRAAIAAAAARPAATISLHLVPAADDVTLTAEVELPAELRGRRLDLMAALYETDLVTAVSRGENGGQTLRNDYVVRLLRRAGRLAPGAASPARFTARLPLAKDWNRSHLGVAAFVQDPKSLDIHGAAAEPIPWRNLP